MADFDGIITTQPEWTDIPSLSSSAIALGGTAGSGAMNAQAVAIAKRTNYLFNYSIQINPTTGNAGIGVAIPLGRFQIGDTSPNIANKIVFGKAVASSENNLPVIGQYSFNGTSCDLVLASTSATGSVRIYTGASATSAQIATGSNTQAVVVDANKRVGINTGSTTLYTTLQLGAGQNNAANPSTTLCFADYSNSQYRITINNSGNYWGIGTTGSNLIIGSSGASPAGVVDSIKAQMSPAGILTIGGFTPNTWSSGNAVELGFGGNAVWGSAGSTYITQNVSYNGSWRFNAGSTNSAAIGIKSGEINFFNYGSGSAGAITSETLCGKWDTSGRLGIGGAPTQKLDVMHPTDVISAVRTTGTTNSAHVLVSSGNGTTSGRYSYARFLNNETSSQDWRMGTYGSSSFKLHNATGGQTLLEATTTNYIGIKTTPVVSLDMGYTTDAFRMSVGSTAQRPTGQFGMIRHNNTLVTPEVFGLNGVAAWAPFNQGGLIAIRRYMNNGTYTYTPTSGTNKILVITVGAGGGGGGAIANANKASAAGGGGGGGYSEAFLTSGFAGSTIVVGLGGTGGGNGGGYGSNGGASSFGGNKCSANGGGGGAGVTGGTDTPFPSSWAGPGGSKSGTYGDVRASGNCGTHGFVANQFGGYTGAGGSGPFGGGGRQIPFYNSGVSGMNGDGPGAGGSGGAGMNGVGYFGGYGSDGCVIIYEYA